ncbi:type VI secretion system lipoprotein TssJ [Advenella sp. EE-W14]|uniref:type VI secretion system lipoprotein TssJ n=1 Tax=Advenella sp. EE-W14 TaxID=2722705 RepID=UPI00145DC040|nr:type VI secretion system lipoprotein TssJ [Advenella sp. EE-W14]
MFAFRLLRSGLLKIGVLAMVMALAGCAASENKMAVPYAVELRGAHVINPNPEGRSAPVKITVYELKSSTAFETSDFFSLQQNPQQALGDQMLEISSVMLQPGQKEVMTAMGNIHAKFLGVVAAFRDLNNSQWRLLVPLPAAKTTNLYKFWQFSPDEARVIIDVDGQSIRLSRQADNN